MRTTVSQSSPVICRPLCLSFASFALLMSSGSSLAQTEPSNVRQQREVAERARVPEALTKIESGEFAGYHVDLVARMKTAEAVPGLEKQFPIVSDLKLKSKIASALIRLGDKDDKYWEYLVQLATPALESTAPDFLIVDKQGKFLPGPSPEFVSWASSRDLSPSSAATDSLYIFPSTIATLGWTRDGRAVPLLRRALESPNHLIQIAAAKGLAEIRDKDSIPLIINACARAPREAATSLAEALVYFDDNSAQSTVDQYMAKDIATAYRNAVAYGKTALGN